MQMERKSTQAAFYFAEGTNIIDDDNNNNSNDYEDNWKKFMVVIKDLKS